MNSRVRGQLCNCVALFDWRGKEVHPQEWLTLALSLFADCDVEPDSFSLTDDDSSDHPAPMEQLRSRLDTTTRLTSLEIFATIPKYKQLLFGWRVSAALNMSRGQTMVLAWDNELRNFGQDYITNLTKRFLQILDPAYGIAYQRPFSKGPVFYAYGMSSGLGYDSDSRVEADKIALWMNERMGQNRHLHGLFRDIYPLNVITKRHLERPINDMTLFQWIVCALGSESLVGVKEGVWIWYVSDERLPEVRKAMERAGLLIS